MLKSLSIIAVLLFLFCASGCGKRCVNPTPEFPVPTETILNTVDATDNAELINWVYRDLFTLWEQLDN